jgi:hypothetical protein
MRLHQRANRMQLHLDHTLGIPRALPGLVRHVLDGLLQRPPQFFEGLAQPGAPGHRNFLHAQEVMLVDPVLQEIETDPHYRWG